MTEGLLQFYLSTFQVQSGVLDRSHVCTLPLLLSCLIQSLVTSLCWL